tara:strand:- start:3384 stop:3569 length:186 start_codon:yes stop_codon:yes gene_type:complete
MNKIQYCFDCGNRIKRYHNSRWNLRPHEAKHLDDVCECDVPLTQYSDYAIALLAQMKVRDL